MLLSQNPHEPDWFGPLTRFRLLTRPIIDSTNKDLHMDAVKYARIIRSLSGGVVLHHCPSVVSCELELLDFTLLNKIDLVYYGIKLRIT